MDSRTKRIFIPILILLFVLIMCILIYMKYVDKNLLYLPDGKLESSYISPNGEQKLNLYIIDGGSLSANAIRGEIENSNKKYNIYWCYSDCDFDVKVEWKNNKVVVINNTEINIIKDKIKIKP